MSNALEEMKRGANNAHQIVRIKNIIKTYYAVVEKYPKPSDTDGANITRDIENSFMRAIKHEANQIVL